MKSICVFCGSSTGTNTAFSESAVQLGRFLASRKITLVYGGSNVGLMGLISAAARDAGGKVTGIIPERIEQHVCVQPGVEMEVVPDMHARKSRMYELSDGFIALPGGIGTLEELFEVWTWNQIGYHTKPLALFNVENYYSRLEDFLDHAVDSGFLQLRQRTALIVGTSPEALLEQMESWRPPSGTKWDCPEKPAAR